MPVGQVEWQGPCLYPTRVWLFVYDVFKKKKKKGLFHDKIKQATIDTKRSPTKREWERLPMLPSWVLTFSSDGWSQPLMCVFPLKVLENQYFQNKMCFARKLVANSTYASFDLSGFIFPINSAPHSVANLLQFGSCALPWQSSWVLQFSIILWAQL